MYCQPVVKSVTKQIFASLLHVSYFEQYNARGNTYNENLKIHVKKQNKTKHDGYQRLL